MSSLTYVATWKSISARIHGLERAASVHARFLAVVSKSPYGADKALQKHCEDICTSIVQFREAFTGQLPPAAVSAIDRFMQDGGKQIRDNTYGDAGLLRTIIVKLVAFEAEVTFCLDDQFESIRSAAELAFMHLKRLIVADEDYRKKWQGAFAKHETHCEKLGGVHLLWHGIWAFKVDAKGAKTDLVYQDRLRADRTSAVLGLVHTEWKRVKGSAEAAYAEAKHEAALYSGGVLAGVELTSHRYLIAVTDQDVVPPDDIVEGAVTFRHVNIAVNPTVPSKAAKRLARS